MKQAARISFPISVALSPVSAMTAYTTATEVVDNAIPAICEARHSQPKIQYAPNHAPRNGSTKATTPIATAGFQCVRSEMGSISAPARKVSSTAPNPARKLIHSVA